MSMQDGGFKNPLPPQGTSSSADIVTQLQGIVQQLSSWVLAFQGRMVFGTFTLAAAATKTVLDTAVRSNSVITLMPTNAPAAQVMGGVKSLYTSTIASGTSFTVATRDGSSAAGTETFSYIAFTPS